MKKRFCFSAHYYVPDVASVGQILKNQAEKMQDTFEVIICCIQDFDLKQIMVIYDSNNRQILKTTMIVGKFIYYYSDLVVTVGRELIVKQFRKGYTFKDVYRLKFKNCGRQGGDTFFDDVGSALNKLVLYTKNINLRM